VAGPQQKSLGMDLQNESSENKDLKKKKKETLDKKNLLTVNNDDRLKEELVKIERDPVKLLKVF
jgi:hypothetical protein